MKLNYWLASLGTVFVTTVIGVILVIGVWRYGGGYHKMKCCNAKTYYTPQELVREGYSYCVDMEVDTGDGKDCGVWYAPLTEVLVAGLVSPFLGLFVWDYVRKKRW